MTDEEGRILLRLARGALHAAFGDSRAFDSDHRIAETMPGLQLRCGAFVTLKLAPADASERTGRLRGCIGTMESRTPLHETVPEISRKAAFEDPRFPSLTEAELGDVRISISAMTPLLEVDGPDEIVVGRDGVELSCPPHRAVFLPQVATEQGWDRLTLLRQLAIKAGLPAEDWARGSLSTFRAEVVSESDRRPDPA